MALTVNATETPVVVTPSCAWTGLHLWGGCCWSSIASSDSTGAKAELHISHVEFCAYALAFLLVWLEQDLL